MNTNRRGRLVGGQICNEPTSVERKIDAALRKAASLQIDAVPVIVCDPQGAEEKKLHRYLVTIEPTIMEVGGSGFEMVVGLIDKSRQNPINKLGGMDQAGEMAMRAYWSVADRSTSLMCAMEGFDLAKVDLIRVSPTSDEGIFIMGGRDVTAQLKRKFGEEASLRDVFRGAWKIARKGLDLRAFTYTLDVPQGNGSVERFDLDLEAFSRVLRHPEMVVSSSVSLSEPRRVRSSEREGFIHDEIRNLENREIAFYDALPKSFRGNNGGRAEVASPFFTNLMKTEQNSKDSGSYVEIKLRAKPEDARELLRFVSDHPEWKGTSKGYAAIFSGNFGMSAFNTFLGKARTNNILTFIAQAMGDISSEHKTVLPMNGGHLSYWVDMPSNDLTVDLVRKAIMRRMRGELGDLDIGLEPSIIIVDAQGMKLSDMRARFILNSMGKDLYPPQVLDMTDFVLNFIENVHPAYQQQIYEALAKKENGGKRVSMEDLDNMQMLRRICSSHRTIRDTEDIVWTMRRDNELPEDTRPKKDDLETWLFEFSYERYEHIFRLLAETIRNQIRNRNVIRRGEGLQEL
ncbi:MAG: hypothetical protein V1861_05610 [Candidatus Micrarchaeota archaeon]